jgi:hypothetical protein
MLCVTIKSVMLIVIVLIVILLLVILLNVIMLNVILLNVIMLNAVTPTGALYKKNNNLKSAASFSMKFSINYSFLPYNVLQLS